MKQKGSQSILIRRARLQKTFLQTKQKNRTFDLECPNNETRDHWYHQVLKLTNRKDSIKDIKIKLYNQQQFEGKGPEERGENEDNAEGTRKVFGRCIQQSRQKVGATLFNRLGSIILLRVCKIFIVEL